MRTHFFQHVPFEGLGSIEAWLKNAGHNITSTQFFDSAALPNIDDVDFLIVMGGPMSVHDTDAHPWLADEKRFIKNMIEAKKPVLGICLGAQLIANAMGAKVYANTEKEIGWFDIQSVSANDTQVFQFPDACRVFHWHGETFSLPNGAIQLAKSTACKNQAFQIGNHVIGLQFHLETTPESAQAIVANCEDELIEGTYIQSADNILAAPKAQYAEINKLMGSVLEYLTKQVG